MSIVSGDSPTSFYEIKSADLLLVALVLKTHEIAAVVQALQRQLGDNPKFFDQESVMIDVSGLPAETVQNLDLPLLLSAMQQFGMVPVAIKGAQGEVLTLAKGLGLLDASDARLKRSKAIDEANLPVERPVQVPKVLEMPIGAMVIDKPLRSGQQIYAKGRDLIVLAMVNGGAEIIADGHIHVYANLRGKVIAGARGNVDAKIFALVMEPELISIAGVYRTSENPLPNNVLGKMAQVSLKSGADGDKLVFTSLQN
jgi:septum site-determining protein MinC